MTLRFTVACCIIVLMDHLAIDVLMASVELEKVMQDPVIAVDGSTCAHTLNMLLPGPPPRTVVCLHARVLPFSARSPFCSSLPVTHQTSGQPLMPSCGL